MARRGAAKVSGPGAPMDGERRGTAARPGPRRLGPARPEAARSQAERFEPERFELLEDGRRDPPASVAGSPMAGPARRAQGPAGLPADLLAELAGAAGPEWRQVRRRVVERMLAALGAFQRERYRDAARMLRAVRDAVPAAPSPRELLGLSQYHLGQWRAARASLESFAELSGSVGQHPVLMDCERALGRPRRVRERFEELRRASPDPDLLVEARLVLAATMADAGDLAGAIDLLVEAGAERRLRNPAPRHVRQWYLLASLAERSGDLARARELFTRVAAVEPEAYDVEDRLAQLGGPAGPRDLGRLRSRRTSAASATRPRRGRRAEG